MGAALADTWREGYFLGNPRMIEILTRGSPEIVRERPTGAANSRARRMATSTSASSEHTDGVAPATRAISLAAQSSTRWRAKARLPSESRRINTSRACSWQMAPASAPSLSTSTPASGRSTWPTRSSWRRVVTPGFGDAARRGATRTMATGCASHSTPDAGSSTWSSCSFIRPGWCTLKRQQGR